MTETRPPYEVEWRNRGYEWDSEEPYDPDTLQPIIPPWRAPYHAAAQHLRARREELTRDQ